MKMNLLDQPKTLRLAAVLCLAGMFFTAGAALLIFHPALAAAQDQPPPPHEQRDQPDFDGPPEGGESGRPPRGERWKKWIEERGGERGGDEQGGRTGRAGRWLGFVGEFNRQAQDPVQAIGLAAVGVKEYYRRQGKPEEALPVLDEFLKSAKDQKVRNVLLFAVRQIYDEQKNGAKVLELSRQIMQENIAAIEKR